MIEWGGKVVHDPIWFLISFSLSIVMTSWLLCFTYLLLSSSFLCRTTLSFVTCVPPRIGCHVLHPSNVLWKPTTFTTSSTSWSRVFWSTNGDTSTSFSSSSSSPPGRVANITEWLQWSSNSLQQYTGKSLLDYMIINDEGSESNTVQSFEEAHENTRYAILSHGIQSDPIYNYFNQGAIEMFQYESEEIYSLPSCKSAPPNLRQDRATLIQASIERGFQTYTEATRVTKYGTLFQINDGMLWNVYDDNGNRVGQTTLFDRTKTKKLED